MRGPKSFATTCAVEGLASFIVIMYVVAVCEANVNSEFYQ